MGNELLLTERCVHLCIDMQLISLAPFSRRRPFPALPDKEAAADFAN
jgi:hypothetical protein